MDAQEYSSLAKKHLNEGNFDGAITALTEAIRLEPDFPFHYAKRGMAHRSRGELDLAIADISEAIRLEPNRFGSFYFERGLTYILKGDNPLAIADTEMAVKLEPQNKDYREALEEFKSNGISSTANSEHGGTK